MGKYFGSADVKDGILEQSTNHQLEFGELAATMKSDTEKPGLSSCHDERNFCDIWSGGARGAERGQLPPPDSFKKCLE